MTIELSEYVIDAIADAVVKKMQEPCEDAISRQAAEKITWEEPSYTDALNVLTEVRDKIRALPPVTPQENERSCVACEWSKDGHCAGTEECHLCMWESQFKPKTWHWISHYDEDAKEGWYECDRCHTERAFNTKFCPDCGARMVELQESEVLEDKLD